MCPACNQARFPLHAVFQGLDVQVWRKYEDFVTELTARFPHEEDGIKAFYGECWMVSLHLFISFCLLQCETGDRWGDFGFTNGVTATLQPTIHSWTSWGTSFIFLLQIYQSSLEDCRLSGHSLLAQLCICGSCSRLQ